MPKHGLVFVSVLYTYDSHMYIPKQLAEAVFNFRECQIDIGIFNSTQSAKTVLPCRRH